MFLKLFKYDFLSVIKKIVYYYIVLIAIAIISKIILLILQNTQFAPIAMLPGMVYIACASLGITVTVILCMIRYYKNMLSDQGYLTHTLPVKRSHILLAKLLNTLVIELITVVVILISVLIYAVEFIPQVFDLVGQMLSQLSLNPDNIHIVFVILFVVAIMILSAVFNVSYISMCLTLGASHNKNKLAMAFVYYMVINFVLQILYVIIMVIGVLLISSFMVEFSFALLYVILSLICVGIIALTVIAYFVNLTFLNKKLNLE